MGILSWIILGGIAGWLASLVVGNSKDQGIIGNIVVGIFGALLGGWLFGLTRGEDFSYTEFSISNLAVAFVGSIILLFIVRALRGRK